MRQGVWVLLASLVLVWGMGCKKAAEPVYPDILVDARYAAGKGIGESCSTITDCRPGLNCTADAECQPSGETPVGQDCVVSAECVENAYCGAVVSCVGPHTYQENSGCTSDADCQSELDPDARCLPTGQACAKAGEGAINSLCVSDGECLPGLFCERIAGITGTCAEGGESDLGAACTSAADCFPGLLCGPGDLCMGLIEALEASAWEGAECDVPNQDNPRAYFEVPGADGLLSEFYRLPFPNDIRLASGTLTAGHPTPGRGPLDFDPIARILDAVNSSLEGFGSTPTIFFRFSIALDFDSVDTDLSDQGANLRYANIDSESENYRQVRGFVWNASDGRQKFLCDNWLRIQTHADDLLEEETTYAVILLKGMRSCIPNESGEESAPRCASDSPLFLADADLVALLAPSAPSDARLSLGWQQYAKLRQYLQDEEIPSSEVLSAAVFTTGAPRGLMERARGTVRALEAPAVSELTVCEPGVESPCVDENDDRRVCGVHENFLEIHGKVSLPMYQTGTPPYLTPADGGGIRTDSSGNPILAGVEDVCFALTVPKTGTAPETGWPVVIYGHGTGGTFRSHILDGTAANLTSIAATPSGAGAAVLGFDAVMHGPRRHSPLDPETLYFNIANPEAARGNSFQNAIDYFSMVRVVETHGVTGGGLSTSLDAERIGFFGHSQGGASGPLFAAYEPLLGPVVLSGAGAGLVESLLNKTSPVDVAGGVSAALQEDAGLTHPVLTLMQQYFDPVDPANYARALTIEPEEGVPAHNLLMTYGQGDTFTPAATTALLAELLRLDIMEPALDTGEGQAFSGFEAGPDEDPETDQVVPGPITNTYSVGGTSVTLGMTHYTPDGYDGHFVALRHPTARQQIGEFFGSWFRSGVAQIIAP